ncbi:MAG: quinone-dependent dihydroorotate dehydrogenase [Candidatus Pacebacteria bacterium]|nr:quinone-dependent dihydroorotate dehydrogenase [Candidatus Paceibacterota bacterium]
MVYKRIIRPLIFYWSRDDPEKAHELGIKFLYYMGKYEIIADLIEKLITVKDRRLEAEVWGLIFRNPLALAAGFDKDGIARYGIQSLGVGFEVIGSFTQHEQPGNIRPRTKRFPEDKAIINRMGFNNPGSDNAALELANKRKLSVPLGISLGKSLKTPIENAVEDYLYSLRKLYLCGDFFIVNISSPNTLNLRELQKKEYLKNILIRLQEEIEALTEQYGTKKPLLIKIAPDLTEEELDDILDICLELEIDGIVAVNTTTSREGLSAPTHEEGGLSGKPLWPKAIRMVRYIDTYTKSQIPIIAVGGISTPEQAREMLEIESVKLIKLFTAFAFEGPFIIRKINEGILKQT